MDRVWELEKKVDEKQTEIDILKDMLWSKDI